MNTPRRILLVEDDPKFRFVLQTILEQRGCQVTVCQDAEEARKLDGDSFTAAIIDARLPVENGTDLAKHLMSRHEDLKVILVTGFGDLEKQDAGLKGASILVKPFDIESLWKLL